ncbi:MAG: hypothetical protein U5J78_00830 [Parasphingorhabdus sp.]|nr:hypothetical protein [Parasphingorhabdus sp.]
MIRWPVFWLLWLGGLAALMVLIFTNSALVTTASPGGILDHQAAGSAARVNAIQLAWADAGKSVVARWSMIGDLLFITLYSIGGIIGGRLIWRDGFAPRLKKLALIAILVFALFGLADYTETLAQLAQLLQGEGSDFLSALAALARPAKMLFFVAATLLLILILIWRAIERRA